MESRIREPRRLPHRLHLLNRVHDQKALRVPLQDVDEEHRQPPRQLGDLLPKLNHTESQHHRENHPHQEDHLRPGLQPHPLSRVLESSPSRTINALLEPMLRLFPILDLLLHPDRRRPPMMMGTSQESQARNSGSHLLSWDREIQHHLQHQVEVQFHPRLPPEKRHNLMYILYHQQLESLPRHYHRKHPLYQHHMLLHYPRLRPVLYLLPRQEIAGLLPLRHYLNQVHHSRHLCLDQMHHPLHPYLNQTLRRHRLYLNRTPRHHLRCLLLVGLLPRPRLHRTAILGTSLVFLLYHNPQAIEQIY